MDKEGFVYINCSVVSAGYLTPMVKCEHTCMNESKQVSLDEGNHTLELDNNVVTSTWRFSCKKESCNTIICSTEVEHTYGPKKAIAVYITGMT